MCDLIRDQQLHLPINLGLQILQAFQFGPQEEAIFFFE